MSDDRYDELIKQKRAEREEAERHAQQQRADDQRIEQVYFHRRNALYEAIRKRALELEKKYPELGQLFVESMGDSLRLSKSQIPWGSFTIEFDPFSKRVAGSFRFQSGYAGDVLFEMSPAAGEETVELWSGGRAYSDAEIVDLIFDSFMPHVS